jgi:SAM-dependent methyltransferase
MDAARRRWEENYRETRGRDLVLDPWLDRYEDELMEAGAGKVLNLGCGEGADALDLDRRGVEAVSGDFALNAVRRLRRSLPGARLVGLDLRRPLPFRDGAFRVVVADLCLHYFGWEQTRAMVSEITRVLAGGGLLAARVNSANDRNFGAGGGRKVEEHLFDFGGHRKRFFDRDHVMAAFAGLEAEHLVEYAVQRFGHEKVLWEVAGRKPAGPGDGRAGTD